MFASADEVAANLGRSLTTAEYKQVEVWIGWAESTIKARLGNLLLLDADMLNMVVTEAVSRRMRMPEPVSQVSVTVDDGTVSKTYQRATGLIEILPEWWEALGWSGSSEGFSITPYFRSASPA